MSSVLVTHSSSKNVFGNVVRCWLEENKCYSTGLISGSRGYDVFWRVCLVQKSLAMNPCYGLLQLTNRPPNSEHALCSQITHLEINCWYVFGTPSDWSVHCSLLMTITVFFFFPPPEVQVSLVFFYFGTLDPCLFFGLCYWESILSRLPKNLAGCWFSCLSWTWNLCMQVC